MTKLLSIVIPVYKVEDYIRKCIESLIVPDPEQLELLDIVVVNDGTPDRSSEIAREYEARYPSSVRVIDQENRGHGGAWNHGTELAEGKYLFYLDSDDWFDTDQFSRLITFLQTCDTDMVMLDKTNWRAYENREELVLRHDMDPGVIYDANTYDWFGYGDGSLVTYAHNTVYRTSMMQKYMPLFCEKVMYDDVSLQMIPITVAENFVYTPLNVYHYLIGRPGQSFDPVVRARHADHVTKVVAFVLDWMERYRTVAPQGTTRRAWVDDLFYGYGPYHLWEIACQPYGYVKTHIGHWYDFYTTKYPDSTEDTTVRLYKALPLPIFYMCLKSKRFYDRCARLVKRKIGFNSLSRFSGKQTKLL